MHRTSKYIEIADVKGSFSELCFIITSQFLYPNFIEGIFVVADGLRFDRSKQVHVKEIESQRWKTRDKVVFCKVVYVLEVEQPAQLAAKNIIATAKSITQTSQKQQSNISEAATTAAATTTATTSTTATTTATTTIII
ncbi:hypothetical protein Tco_0189312 [Tanacetum coccineum]